MIRYCFIIVFNLFGIVHGALAFPWFQQMNDSTNYPRYQLNFDEETPEKQIDFSGVWTGQCDNKPAVDLIIKQDHDQLTISYGFMEEKYVLGEIKSESASHSNASENSSTTVRWNTDNTGLIFINYNSFINASGNLNVFFSKVSMFLKEGQLMVNGQHYQTNNSPDVISQELMSCVYNRK